MYTKPSKIIFFLLLLPVSFTSAKRDTDSLTKMSNTAGEKHKAEFYLKTADSFEKSNLIDSAVYYDTLALRESRITGNISLEAESLYKTAVNFYLLGKNRESLELSRQALSVYKKMNDKIGMAKSLNSMGIIYENFADYEKVLISRLDALRYYEEAKNPGGIVLTYNYLGILYQSMKEYSKSLDYYNKALKILEINPDRMLLATTYNNLGNLNLLQGNLKNALKFSLESLEIKKSINAGAADIIDSYLIMGTILRDLKQYGASAEQYKLGMKLADKTGNKNARVLLLKNMGILYDLTGKYQPALQYFGESKKLAEEINFNRIILANLQGLAEVYKQTAEYKLSLQYYEKYRQAKDSIFSKNLKSKLDTYHNRYETEKKAKEIQQIKSSAQRTVSILLTSAFLLILILLVVIMNRYRIKTKTNLKLLNKNKEVAGLFEKLKNLNKNLADSESTYRYLFVNNPVAMFILEEETLKILSVNKAAADQYGFSESEFADINFENLWDTANKDNFLNFKKRY